MIAWGEGVCLQEELAVGFRIALPALLLNNAEDGISVLQFWPLTPSPGGQSADPHPLTPSEAGVRTLRPCYLLI